MYKYKGMISVELEFEHLSWSYSQLKEFRNVLLNKYEDKIKNLSIKPDISLLNAGIELTGSLTPFHNWYPILKELYENNFVMTKRTGIHVHFDVVDKITDINGLKKLLVNINEAQMNRIFNVKRNLNSFHNIYPPAVLTKLMSTYTIEAFAHEYLFQFRGKPIINAKNALMLKGLEHEHWIDIAPILRYLLKCPEKDRKGFSKAAGSIELRYSLVGSDAVGRLYEKLNVEKIKEVVFDIMRMYKFLIK